MRRDGSALRNGWAGRSLLLLLCTACAGTASKPAEGPALRHDTAVAGAPDDGTDGSADGSADGVDRGDPVDSGEPAIDEDGDGFFLPEDCDDTDDTVFPGHPEVCDGVDEDCDGVIDNGTPNDGAGCTDPGPPPFPSTADIVHITVRTGTGEHDGTDDGMSACLGAGRCMSLNKPEWDDLESGEIDVQVLEGAGWPRSELDAFSLRVGAGTDRYVPACVSARLDGEPVYCRRTSGVYIGNEGAELPVWTDPDGLTSTCTTCYDSPLTLGPVVGATGAEQVTLWLRTDATRAVKVRVADSTDGLLGASPVAWRYPRAAADFTEQVTIYGLRPATTWHYDLEIEGVRYGPWSFTTPPSDPGPTRLRLAFGSCARDQAQPIFGVIAAYDPDVFLFLGDTHYGNTSDLADLRQFYRWGRSRPIRRDLLHSRTVLSTWDDHDYVGNNLDGTAEGKDVGLRVFAEYQPNASYGLPDVPGVFSAHRWGDVAIFLLDDRYWRGLDDSILGDAQEAWLLDSLAVSDATFKLLASGSQWTSSGTSDSWAAFPTARQRFLDGLVTRGVEGVVLLSGDIHRSELLQLAAPAGGYDLPELTSSPLANTWSTCRGSGEQRVCVDDANSFIVLDIDTSIADPSIEVQVVDGAARERGSWLLLRSELSL